MNPIVLAGLAFLASDLVVSSNGGSAAPSRLWPIRFEDYVLPPFRAEMRARAEAAGGRWGAISIDRKVWFRADSRANLLFKLTENGYKPGADRDANAWER